MRRLAALVTLAPLACGRLGFDATGGTDDAIDDAIVDTGDADGAVNDGPPATSCLSLPAACGPAGTSDCCASLVVGGGTYFRSYDGVGFDDMSYPATVSSFRLDTYAVTVGRFRSFVAAGLGTQANPPPANAGARTLAGIADQGGWDTSWNASLAVDSASLVAALNCNVTYQTWTDSQAGNEGKPIGCLSWYEAMAFCAWDGGFLPTEAEWNYAASGGSMQRAYPWSSPAGSTTIDCARSNFGGTNWPTTACAAGGATNVGSLSPQGDGAWGHADLGGNVWEWVLDFYAAPYSMPCSDCANLIPAASRVYRGGSFNSDALNQRAAFRRFATPLTRFYDNGVRCARHAP